MWLPVVWKLILWWWNLLITTGSLQIWKIFQPIWKPFDLLLPEGSRTFISPNSSQIRHVIIFMHVEISRIGLTYLNILAEFPSLGFQKTYVNVDLVFPLIAAALMLRFSRWFVSSGQFSHGTWYIWLQIDAERNSTFKYLPLNSNSFPAFPFSHQTSDSQNLVATWGNSRCIKTSV